MTFGEFKLLEYTNDIPIDIVLVQGIATAMDEIIGE